MALKKWGRTYLSREHISQSDRVIASAKAYQNKITSARKILEQHKAEKDREAILENYLQAEGYQWTFRRLTIPILSNFLTNKEAKMKTLNWKRDDLVDDALKYIHENPNPAHNSVTFNQAMQRFITDPRSSHVSNALSILNSNDVTLQVTEDENETSITFEQTKVLGSHKTPSYQHNPFADANQPFRPVPMLTSPPENFFKISNTHNNNNSNNNARKSVAKSSKSF